MSLSNSIRMMLIKRGNISEAELARRINSSPQNLNNKMKRDNFTEQDLKAIASALGCTLSICFTINDSNEVYRLTDDGLDRLT